MHRVQGMRLGPGQVYKVYACSILEDCRDYSEVIEGMK